MTLTVAETTQSLLMSPKGRMRSNLYRSGIKVRLGSEAPAIIPIRKVTFSLQLIFSLTHPLNKGVDFLVYILKIYIGNRDPHLIKARGLYDIVPSDGILNLALIAIVVSFVNFQIQTQLWQKNICQIYSLIILPNALLTNKLNLWIIKAMIKAIDHIMLPSFSCYL